MATTALVVYEASIAGTAVVPVTPSGTGLANGVTIPNDGNTVVTAINAGAGSSVVTEQATGSKAGAAYTNPTGSVPNDSTPRIFGPFDREVYGTTVTLGFSVATGVTCWATRLPRS
jgi:hypothetical protein